MAAVKDAPAPPKTENLVDDILSLIHQREVALNAELGRIADYKRTITPGDAALDNAALVPTAPSNGSATARRSMSAKNRQALSKRMRAYWKKRHVASKAAGK